MSRHNDHPDYPNEHSARPLVSTPIFRTAYDGRNVEVSNATALVFDEKNEPSLTKQAFVKECDINTILQQFSKTGIISHVNQQAPRYVDMAVLPETYHAACNLVFEAHDSFMSLPAEIRDRFHNNPEELLEFVADDKNYEEAVRLGLIPPSNAPGEAPDASADPGAAGGAQRPQEAGGAPPAASA